MCSLLRALSETITLPSTPSPSKSECNQQWRQAATSRSPSRLACHHPYFLSLPPTLLYFSPFLSVSLSLLSRSKCLHFLQQTVSRGTRVYFATCGDGSLPRQELAASCCWFLTCVPCVYLQGGAYLQGFSPFKGHVEAFDIMRFIGLRGAIGVLFETVRKYNKSTKTTLGFLSGTYLSAQNCSLAARSVQANLFFIVCFCHSKLCYLLQLKCNVSTGKPPQPVHFSVTLLLLKVLV